MSAKTVHSPRLSRQSLIVLSSDISLVLIACLAFMAPFNAIRNIDMRGLLVIVAGGFAWIALVLGYKKSAISLRHSWPAILLTIYGVSCLISTAVNPHLAYNLLGSPYIRLGSLGLLACIGCGLLLRQRVSQRFYLFIYGEILALGIVSIPYNLLYFHTLQRISGVTAQADITACLLGCGILLGLSLLHAYPQWRRQILVAQVFLAGTLVMTQTRAVLGLVLILCVLWLIHIRWRPSLKQALLCFAIGSLIFISIVQFAPHRLTDATFASQSLEYRLSLQSYAWQASKEQPLVGYGPGNLADALNCGRLEAPQLQHTCHQGYFFNSSHNIFLDRLLAIGWLGGLSYALFVMLAIVRGLRVKPSMSGPVYAAILIAAYYFTNVTSIELELLFCILLCSILPREHHE